MPKFSYIGFDFWIYRAESVAENLEPEFTQGYSAD